MYSGKIAVPPGGGGIVVRFMMGNKWLSTTKVADRKFRKLAVFTYKYLLLFENNLP
jgi:hypothetical protein